MKKIYKVMVFVLMLVVSAASIVACPLSVFAIAPAAVGVSIIIAKMPTKGTVNQTIKIPAGTVSEGTLKVTLRDSDGVEIKLGSKVGEGSDAYYEFTPSRAGIYKVQYEATSGSKITKSEVYTLTVTGTKSVFSFESNSPFILPSTIGGDGKVVLPYPSVYVDGDTTNDSEENVVKGLENNISILVKDPNNEVVDLSSSKVKIDGQEYYVFTPVTKDDNVVYGTYSITYVYAPGNVAKTYSIKVSQNYSVENQNVSFSWVGSMPTSLELGKEASLPKPSTFDSSNSSEPVSTFTKVSVVFHDPVNGVTKYYDVDQQDFTFVPMDKASGSAYYTVNYKIYTLEQLDLANYQKAKEANEQLTFDEYLENVASASNSKVISKDYSISKATDTTAPAPKVVADYTVESDGTVSAETTESLEDEDVSYSIPTRVKTGVEVSIPAIYATDEYSQYEDLTLNRSIIVDKKSNSVDGTSTIEGEDSNSNVLYNLTQAKVNESAKVIFRFKGTYTIKYSATDKSGNTKEVSYKIIVTDSLVDNVKPYITMPQMASSAEEGDEISFNAPSVVDYAKDHTIADNAADSSTVDANVKTSVFYYFGEYVEGQDGVEINKDSSDSTKYSFVVPEIGSNTKLTVVVRAEDDAKYADGNTENNVSESYKTIALFKTEEDTEVPTLVTDLSTLEFTSEENGSTIGQGETVNIPTIQFNDNNLSSLSTSLVVYDAKGNEIKVRGISYDCSTGKVSNGRFVTTVSGQYRVVITATDIGGNSLVNSMILDVNSTRKPTIEVGEIPSTMEIGEKVDFPKPIVKDGNGNDVTNSSTTVISIVGDSNNPQADLDSKNFKITPKATGTYTFHYSVVVDGSDEVLSNTFSISFVDTVKPVINIDEMEGGIPSQVAYVKDLPISLPYATVSEDGATLTVEVTNPSGNNVTVEGPVHAVKAETYEVGTQYYQYNEEDKVYELVDVTEFAEGETYYTINSKKYYSFVPNQNGTYKVVYTAVDAAGNSSTVEQSIQVGDCTAPTIVIEKDNQPKDAAYYIGDTLKIDLTKISVNDAVDGDYTIKTAINNSKFSITLTDPSNSTVSFTKEDDLYTYKFDTAGTYTLKYTATDDAGNSDYKSYTFTVKAKTNDTSFTEQSWGIVLIVVSLVLLGGVVVYFVKTKDASSDKAKKADKKKTK